MTVARKSTAGIGSGGLATRAEVNPLAIRPAREPKASVSTPGSPGVERGVGGIRAGRAHCSVLRVRALGRGPWHEKVARISDSDLENSIASASIYQVKLLRAYGGCLGARSR